VTSGRAAVTLRAEMTKTASSRPKTGSDIDAFCSKCDLDLAHVIVAMVGDRPVRVQCKTCRSTHAYRGKKSVDGPAKRATKAKGASTRAPSRGDYDRAIEGKDLSRAKRYKPATAFDADDVIDHPTFRFGVVTRLLSDGKIEVVFESGVKTLVHAREAATAS
jgi:hypothetical protein